MSHEFVLPKGIRNLTKIVAFLSGLSASRSWRITIAEERSTRSIQQCRYLNGVAYKLLGEKTGYERDDISEFMCGTYWGWKQVKVPKTPSNPQGVDDQPIRTTTTDDMGNRNVLTTTEFMDFVAFVQRFGASKGVFIPDPDPEYCRQDEARAA